jgi:hypothetical protein
MLAQWMIDLSGGSEMLTLSDFVRFCIGGVGDRGHIPVAANFDPNCPSHGIAIYSGTAVVGPDPFGNLGGNSTPIGSVSR